ncbi:acyl-CoA dehydrogenase family protein [Myxococcota bacterium]|nr:acyl-CoA dehydrogenase family protein [Myxococcota bacterium]
MTTTRPGEDESVAALVESLERFGRERLNSEMIDKEASIPRPIFDELTGLGVFGITIPEEYGGAGLGLYAACHGVAALARYDRSVATTVGLHLGLGTRGLVKFGSPALKEKYLPEIAEGRRIAAFSATEPGAGSDLTGIKTTATLRGDDLVLNGQKIWVTNARFAGLVTALAATPELGAGKKTQSLVVVDPTWPGVQVGREERKLGLKGSSTASVYFDNVVVPRSHAIVPEAGGPPIHEPVLAFGRTVMAAGCVGAARAALDKIVEQVTTRRQFGKVLASFELVERQVAELVALHFAMGAIVDDVAAVEDDWEQLAKRSTVAKVLCSEGACEIGDRAIQLFGGSGYIEESGVPIFLRDARVTRIFEGANDVLMARMGAAELATKKAGEPATIVGRRTRDLASVLSARFGIRALGQQAELHRLGRLAILSESCESVLRRAEREGTPFARTAAEHWLSLAEERTRALTGELTPRTRAELLARALVEKVIR